MVNIPCPLLITNLRVSPGDQSGKATFLPCQKILCPPNLMLTIVMAHLFNFMPSWKSQILMAVDPVDQQERITGLLPQVTLLQLLSLLHQPLPQNLLQLPSQLKEFQVGCRFLSPPKISLR